MEYLIETSRPYDGMVVSHLTSNKRLAYDGRTVEEYVDAHPDKTFKVVTGEEINAMNKAYVEKLCSEPFIEITESRYFDLLECLPPARSGSNWFFLGEAYNFNVHLFCFRKKGRYFSAHRQVDTNVETIREWIKDFDLGGKEVANGN